MNKIALSMLMSFIAIDASAFECDVKVLKLLVYTEGTVTVMHSGRGDYTHICNLNVETHGVSTTTCAMWTALLQSIKKKGGVATFMYAGAGTCATMLTHGIAPYPHYIGDVTP